MNTDQASEQEELEVPNAKKPSCLKSLGGCLLTMAILIVIPFLWLIAPSHYLGNRPAGEEYDSTRFEFRYGFKTRVLFDPHNKMRFVYGDLPDEIFVEDDGKRVIVYNSQKAVIRSFSDSIDIGPEYMHHKGWMGIWSHESELWVNSEGVVTHQPDGNSSGITESIIHEYE